MFGLVRFGAFIVIILFAVNIKLYSQWDVIKDLIEKEVEKEVTNYVLKEVRLYNPYRQGNTSLDQFANDVLQVVGLDLRNEPLRIKIYKIIDGNILHTIRIIKFNNQWLSIADVYTQFNADNIESNYRLVQEAARNKNDNELALSLTMLMASISNFER